MSELSARYQSIIDTIEGKSPPPAAIPHSPENAVSAFQNILSGTILPRRITARAENGSRLSVVVKNRRVLKIAEVHPPELWDHEISPQEIKCVSDYETFAHPFASTLTKVIGDEAIQIDQALIDDTISGTGSGYQASMLAQHIKQAQNYPSASTVIEELFDDFPTMARVRFGDDDTMFVPDISQLNPEWFKAKIDGIIPTLAEKNSDLRFLVLDGDKPQAIAMAWLEGSGCLIVAEDPATFDTLEKSINSLRQYL